MHSNRYHLKDIILLALIGIVFGVIYYAGAMLYNLFTIALTPVGLAPMANDLTMGLWCMAGPLSALLLRRVGAAFLGEFLGAAGEMFLGGQWGAASLISGFVQGIATEAGFTFTGYKRYDWFSLSLSCALATVITFGWDWFRNGYAAFTPQLNLLLFVTRLISMFLFSGLLVKLIANLLDRAHAIKTVN